MGDLEIYYFVQHTRLILQKIQRLQCICEESFLFSRIREHAKKIVFSVDASTKGVAWLGFWMKMN